MFNILEKAGFFYSSRARLYKNTGLFAIGWSQCSDDLHKDTLSSSCENKQTMSFT